MQKQDGGGNYKVDVICQECNQVPHPNPTPYLNPVLITGVLRSIGIPTFTAWTWSETLFSWYLNNGYQQFTDQSQDLWMNSPVKMDLHTGALSRWSSCNKFTPSGLLWHVRTAQCVLYSAQYMVNWKCGVIRSVCILIRTAERSANVYLLIIWLYHSP